MPARGSLALADSPRRVLVRASWREASSLEKRPRRRPLPSGDPETEELPAHTRRQLARGTQMVRGDEASTFFRLTWSCFIWSFGVLDAVEGRRVGGK